MDLSQTAQLGLALLAAGAALFGFNALVARGPRGTVWIIALCLLTWSTMLPIALHDPDIGLPPGLNLLVTILQLTGIIGALLGILDALAPRLSDLRQDIAEKLLRQPLLWGIALCANFYALLYQGVIESPLLWRYAAGHPMEIVEAAFFFVGMSILAIRFGRVAGQFQSLRGTLLGGVPAGGQSVAECDRLLARLEQLPRSLQDTYLVRRLSGALQFVRRKGSAADLDAHLRHLEELDAVQMHAGYATLRIIIWAIPILGFLGTVIGITVAIANLSPSALEQSMNEVTQGLGVAFDTTAEALALTMVLMFAKSLVERVEDRLLAGVDARTAEELVGRFQPSEPQDDPNVATIRRMSEQVLEAVEALASRQSSVWREAIEETHQQWADVSMAAGQILKNSLSKAVAENLEQHARILSQNALKHSDRLSSSAAEQVEKLQHGAQETVVRLREGLENLAELLVAALERHGEVLSANERELAERQARSFEHMAREPSGAMELIGSRVGQPQPAQSAELTARDATSQAA